MCGITGRINFSKLNNINHSDIKGMTDVISHRGPDDEGFFCQDNVGLGFRRLSIIDLHTGHQPMSNQDDTMTIVFNGEIYNYLEQRQYLIKKGYQFKTTTDTEVILHLYQEYGVECLQYLRGMFGFVIWDANKQQLFCARDRFGIKPFFYYSDNKKFVFGSEIKSILQCDEIDKSISFNALDSYLAFGYITSDLSIYKSIHKLQPAHYLLLSLEQEPRIEIKKYWHISFEPDYNKSEEQWMEEIESCLSETVKQHMIADVPLGAFLSGGIDSSSVVAMMAKNSTRPVKTFSIGFKEKEFNELEYAREVAKKYNCEHHEQIVEPESIGLLPKLVSAYDEPFADASAIPTYYVCKMAREYVTVALSGDGGDELFAGYDSYHKFNKLLSNPFNFSSPALNRLIWGNVNKIIPQSVKGKGLTYFLSQKRNDSFAYLSLWTIPEREKLLKRSIPLIDYGIASELFKVQLMSEEKNYDSITKMQHLDMQTYMVDDILTKVDRASMLNSLEVRVPLMDHKFAELSFKIPSRLKLNGSRQKYILKKAMAPYLPDSILNHPKQGFGIPLSLWFKDDLKTYIKDTLGSANCLLYNYVNKEYVQKSIIANQPGSRDFSSKIWSLLVLNEWLNQNK